MYVHIFRQGNGTYYVFHTSNSPEPAKEVLKKKGKLQRNENLRHDENDPLYPLRWGGVYDVKEGLVIGAELNDVDY